MACVYATQVTGGLTHESTARVVPLSVVGWAYAVGSMFALIQDRAFRRALTRRRFAREVRRIADPFLLAVG